MHSLEPKRTALVVIDVQKAFDLWEEAGRRRNHPAAVSRIAGLLEAFRKSDGRVFHVRHIGTTPESSFRPEGAGFPVKEEAAERPGEPVILKTVNSAFIGTNLEARLRSGGIGTVVICGATSNHCVETTSRMSGNLGFDTKFVSDATWTFDHVASGRLFRAEDIQAMTEANMTGEFAEVVQSRDVIEALGN